MRGYSLTHVRDEVLLRDLKTLIVQERGTMAALLAHLAEVDARKLFVPLGYSSMFAYCVEELRFSEDAAYKRIRAARAARQFPALFEELAEGRLHLTAVCVLAPHLTEENAATLVRAAAYRRQSEIEDILRACSPVTQGAQGLLAPESVVAPELAAQQVEAVVGDLAERQLAVQRVDSTERELAVEQVGALAGGLTERQLAAQQVGLTKGQLAPEQVGGSLLSQVPQLVPLMVLPEIRDRVQYLQALLSHALPSGDTSKLLARALDLLTDEVEKRRFGAGSGVRRRRTGARTRYIPADVRHAVWNRDGGRCTFVGTNGHRCNSDMYLEFDHVDPRNREDTVAGLRLRCNTHNQFEAERIFGTEFMERKREEAKRGAEEARAAKEREKAEKAKDAAENAELEDQIQDVLSALRGLGIRGEQARRAAAHARNLESGNLADRIRAALQFHGECITRSPKTARARYASG